jgi:hypothetical protein
VNREEWLARAITAMRPIFAEHGAEIPSVQVTNGWPSRNALPSARTRTGEHWHGEMAADGVAQIFISPMLPDDKAVLGTLAHELVHAVHPKAGHKGAFVTLSNKMGFVGKPTSNDPGPELQARIDAAVADLGPYPHSPLNPRMTRKKEKTRLIKASCDNCEAKIRLAQSWIDLADQRGGGLTCPICLVSPMNIG